MTFLVLILGLIAVYTACFKASSLQLKCIPKGFILILFTIKLVGALTIWQYYGNIDDRQNTDIFKYYDDGLKLKTGFQDNPSLFFHIMLLKNDINPAYNEVIIHLEHWNADNTFLGGSGNRFMIRLNALLATISGGSYLFHLVFFTFISFVGIIFIFRSIPLEHNLMSKILLILLVVSPTLLFWTSGILKESVIVFYLGLLMRLFQSLKRSNDWKKIPLIIIVISLIFVMKLYVGISVILAIIVLFSNKSINASTHKVALSIFLLIITTPLLLPQKSMYSPWQQINIKREAFTELANKNEAKSITKIPVIDKPTQVIYKGPRAVINVIFRPHIFELKKKSYLPFALESIVIIMLVITSVIFFKKPEKTALTFIYPSLIFILALTMIIGLSTPILGATVRYRAPAILLIYGVIFLIINDLKIFNRAHN